MGHVCVRLSKLRMQKCFGQWERALDLWRAESDAARHAESTSQLRSDLVAQQQRAAAGFLRRWRQRQVAKCLSSWESWTGAAQRRRHAMVQVLQRARQSRLYSAVIAWRSCAEWSARSKQIVVREMQRRDHRRVAFALESWADAVSRKRRMASVLLKIGARRDLLTCCVALDGWTAWLRGHRSLTITSEKLLRRLQNLELSRVMRR